MDALAIHTGSFTMVLVEKDQDTKSVARKGTMIETTKQNMHVYFNYNQL